MRNVNLRYNVLGGLFILGALLGLQTAGLAAEFKLKKGAVIKADFLEEIIRVDTSGGLVELRSSEITSFSISTGTALSLRQDLVSGDMLIGITWPPVFFKEIKLKDGRSLVGKMEGSSVRVKGQSAVSTLSLDEIESYTPANQKAFIKLLASAPFIVQRATVKKALQQLRDGGKARPDESDRLLEALSRESTGDPALAE